MIGAIVQARMDSGRLPGKVLMDLEGQPLLYHIVMRLKQCPLLDTIIIATSEEPSDEPIVSFCQKHNFSYFAGSKDNVLDRYYQAAKKFQLDIIVRITGDCPLIDPEVADRTIRYYLNHQDKFDYVSNARPPTYPDGLDTEVFPFETLKTLWGKATKKYQQEHVTALIGEDKSFRVGNVENRQDISHFRWIVDYRQDLEFVREIYRRLYTPGKVFCMDKIAQVLEKEPQLQEINREFVRNDGFAKSLREEGVNTDLYPDLFKMGIAGSDRIYLREVAASDINETYLSWMKDAEVTKYMESRFQPPSINSLAEHWKKMNNSKDAYLFLAIIDKDKNKHIGNIKIGPIDKENDSSSMGIMIGERSYWGKGYGAEALAIAADYCFRKLHLHKITAGMLSKNTGSIKAFEKAGFSREKAAKSQFLYGREVADVFSYGIINPAGENQQK